MDDENPIAGPGLFGSIDAARKAAKLVAKDGKNTQQHYAYARAEDVIAEARKVLIEAGLVVVPSILKIVPTEMETGQGRPARIVDATMKFTVTHVATGESEAFHWLGSGWDAPGDKAVYKAVTGGTKYFLAHLLAIPFGVDPEEGGEGDGRKPRGRRGTAAKPTGPTIPKARVDKLFKAVPKDRTWREVGVLLGAAGIDGLRAGSGKALHERLVTLSPAQADALEAEMGKAG